ncbi:hypothetical protein [Flavobacterium sp.]|uniref:hypothetical protein n=1 Tax=Flavobacterium sp. TaxID=239 RepID=UPI002610584B|nr:hypothetical protein [Flavobacterium sp.]
MKSTTDSSVRSLGAVQERNQRGTLSMAENIATTCRCTVICHHMMVCVHRCRNVSV